MRSRTGESIAAGGRGGGRPPDWINEPRIHAREGAQGARGSKAKPKGAREEEGQEGQKGCGASLALLDGPAFAAASATGASSSRPTSRTQGRGDGRNPSHVDDLSI